MIAMVFDFSLNSIPSASEKVDLKAALISLGLSEEIGIRASGIFDKLKDQNAMIGVAITAIDNGKFGITIGDVAAVACGYPNTPPYPMNPPYQPGYHQPSSGYGGQPFQGSPDDVIRVFNQNYVFTHRKFFHRVIV